MSVGWSVGRSVGNAFVRRSPRRTLLGLVFWQSLFFSFAFAFALSFKISLFLSSFYFTTFSRLQRDSRPRLVRSSIHPSIHPSVQSPSYFLRAPKLCPMVGRSVGWLIRRSVSTASFRRSTRRTYLAYRFVLLL